MHSGDWFVIIQLCMQLLRCDCVCASMHLCGSRNTEFSTVKINWNVDGKQMGMKQQISNKTCTRAHSYWIVDPEIYTHICIQTQMHQNNDRIAPCIDATKPLFSYINVHSFGSHATICRFKTPTPTQYTHTHTTYNSTLVFIESTPIFGV